MLNILAMIKPKKRVESSICEQLGHNWGEWQHKGNHRPLVRRCHRCGLKQERGRVGARTPRIVYHPRVEKA